MNVPNDLKTVLGMDEAQILEAINRCFTDMNSIHLLTGIPIICVGNKVSALVELKMVKLTGNSQIL